MKLTYLRNFEVERGFPNLALSSSNETLEIFCNQNYREITKDEFYKCIGTNNYELHSIGIDKDFVEPVLIRIGANF